MPSRDSVGAALAFFRLAAHAISHELHEGAFAAVATCPSPLSTVRGVRRSRQSTGYSSTTSTSFCGVPAKTYIKFQATTWNFSVDKSVRIEAGDTAAIERLTQYIVRCPFSLDRIIKVTEVFAGR